MTTSDKDRGEAMTEAPSVEEIKMALRRNLSAVLKPEHSNFQLPYVEGIEEAARAVSKLFGGGE